MAENALKLLSKPWFDWTPAEQEQFPELVQSIFDGGVKIVVLGQKRCFFCGTPIDSEAIGVKKVQQHTGAGLIVTHLCDKCYELPDTGKVLPS